MGPEGSAGVGVVGTQWHRLPLVLPGSGSGTGTDRHRWACSAAGQCQGAVLGRRVLGWGTWDRTGTASPHMTSCPGQGHTAHAAARRVSPGTAPIHPTPPTPTASPSTAALARPGAPDSLPGPGPDRSSPGPPCHQHVLALPLRHWARGCRGRGDQDPARGLSPSRPLQRPSPSLRRAGGGAFLPSHPPASSVCRALGTSAAFLPLPPLGWAPAKEAALPGARGAARPRALPTALGTQGDTADTPRRGMTGVGTWGLPCPPQPGEGAPVTHGTTHRATR